MAACKDIIHLFCSGATWHVCDIFKPINQRVETQQWCVYCQWTVCQREWRSAEPCLPLLVSNETRLYQRCICKVLFYVLNLVYSSVSSVLFDDYKSDSHIIVAIK